MHFFLSKTLDECKQIKGLFGTTLALRSAQDLEDKSKFL
jgi:hypothetical protein